MHRGGFGGQRPPTENLNDFHNDFPSAGEAGGKTNNKKETKNPKSKISNCYNNNRLAFRPAFFLISIRITALSASRN